MRQPKSQTSERDRVDLVYLPDREVQRRYDSLQKLIRGRGFSHEKRIHLETEACYIWRELEYREARKKAHQKYLRNLKKNQYGGNRSA